MDVKGSNLEVSDFVGKTFEIVILTDSNLAEVLEFPNRGR